jgi:hypothetical protein
VVYRIRLIEPTLADFAVLVGDAIRNLRSSLDQVASQLAMQHSGPLTEDAERMTQLLIRISGAQFDDWASSKNKQTKLRRSEIVGKRVPDDSVGTAVCRAAEAISKRLREDNDIGFARLLMPDPMTLALTLPELAVDGLACHAQRRNRVSPSNFSALRRFQPVDGSVLVDVGIKNRAGL